jgi:AIPR protein
LIRRRRESFSYNQKFIQKGSGEPSAAEIGTFTKGVTDVVEQDATEFHQRLQQKFADISVPVNTPGVRLHLILVSTGATGLAKHGQTRIDKLLENLNGVDSNPIASAEVLGLQEVYTGLASDASNSRVSLDATILEWTHVASPYGAYVGIIDGLQLKGWWKQYGKRLVASNIRHALGLTEVNNGIRTTATTDPAKFWYYNNGITLIANDATKAPGGAASRSAGLFTFKGASIVNGAQTVSTLGRIDSDVGLGDVRVPIRIILLKNAPDDFGGHVTRTNNLQNRIEPRDFAAQDPEQRRLRQEMSIESIDYQFYQFVRSEEMQTSSTSCELVEVTTALACASGDPGLVVQLKTGISRFFAATRLRSSFVNPRMSGSQTGPKTLPIDRRDHVVDGASESTATIDLDVSSAVQLGLGRVARRVNPQRRERCVKGGPIRVETKQRLEQLGALIGRQPLGLFENPMDVAAHESQHIAVSGVGPSPVSPEEPAA